MKKNSIMKYTRLMIRTLILVLAFSAMSLAFAEKKLPLKGGENVLFIGNSLTGSLSESLNKVFKANNLPAFNAHRVQIWNQTFETHWTISRKTHPKLFHEKIPNWAKGFAVKGTTTLWKKGHYNDPKYIDRAFIYAAEAIQNGTPEGKPWDYVILQGYRGNLESNKVTKGHDGKSIYEGPFLKYGALLIEEVKKAGAKPILYEAWFLNPEIGGGNKDPKSYYNSNFDRSIANYRILAKAYDIPLIPVGEAMRTLSAERKPEKVRTSWLIRDNVHGTSCGDALLHYCLASALSGKPATELKYEKISKSKWDKGSHYKIGEKENKYDILITKEIDDTIKKVADEYVKKSCPWVK